MEWLGWLFVALLCAVLLAYAVNPKFRADVDRDTAARGARRRNRRPIDPERDAELWPDPPGTGRAADGRWHATHGGKDPRPDA